MIKSLKGQKVEGQKVKRGVKRNGEVEYYVSVKSEDIVLEPEKVKSLTFHDVEILIP